MTGQGDVGTEPIGLAEECPLGERCPQRVGDRDAAGRAAAAASAG